MLCAYEWVLCSRWRNLGLVNDLKLTKFRPRSGEESKDAPNDTPPFEIYLLNAAELFACDDSILT